MKRSRNHTSSATILRIAHVLSAVTVLIMILAVVVSLAVGRTKHSERKQSGPNYVVDEMQIWNGQQLPTPDAFLTDKAENIVRTVQYVVQPQAVIGEQCVAILMQMEDGTVRTENAFLSIKDPVMYWELGTDATPATLLGEDFTDAVFAQSLKTFTTVGTYTLNVNTDTASIPFTLIVQDTVPPAVTLQDSIKFYVNQTVTPEDVIVSCTDASEVTFVFTAEPDTSENGTKTTQLIATDAAGNSVTLDVEYTVSGDGEAPVISGVSNMQTVSGVPVYYLRGVTAEDGHDGAVEVTVSEPEDFNLKQAGDYTITYTATDAAGNVATETAVLTVFASLDQVEELTEEDVYRIGDYIVQEIHTEEMDEKTYARKIYLYVQNHMFYKDNKDVRDWQYGAVIAIYRGYGDCRNYYAFARLLLTCAGFENMMVEHTPPTAYSAKHFWNLVKIDGEWYHFDTTPRVGRSDFFMLTDAELDAYSARNGNCFARDTSLYPATP